MRLILFFAATVSIAGCSDKTPDGKVTTECMTYQHMMTAPMSPDAMQRLQDNCIASQKHR